MEWSGSLDGEGTDHSTTSSPPRRRNVSNANNIGQQDAGKECDSMSEEMDDDLSDDFSILESEEEDESRTGSPKKGKSGMMQPFYEIYFRGSLQLFDERSIILFIYSQMG